MTLIIGFGSLMSYFGINERESTRDIEIFNPFIVRFRGSRGFNTTGRRYMDIGKKFNLEGVQVSIGDIIDYSGNTIECLAFSVKNGTLQKIAQREGYPKKIMEKIRTSLNSYNKKSNIQKGKKDIAEFLWTFYPKQNFFTNYQEKIHHYRKELGKLIQFDVLNAQSYVPHPVNIQCKQKNKIVFGLISIHTDIGAKKDYTNDISLMTFQEAVYSENPPREFYFKDCILGGVHGINYAVIYY